MLERVELEAALLKVLNRHARDAGGTYAGVRKTLAKHMADFVAMAADRNNVILLDGCGLRIQQRPEVPGPPPVDSARLLIL